MTSPSLETVAAELARRLEGLTLTERLALLATLPGRAVFTTSLGIEDQVITWAIAEGAIAKGATDGAIEIATLETGRLFTETVALIDRTEETYGLLIKRYYPEQADVDAYVAAYRLNGFYDSVEARHACCGVRKVKPLGRALAGADYWITGLRRGQSGNRAETPLAEADLERGLIKVNPLADWSLDAITRTVAEEAIPVNPLHGRGYPSIGCEPCTRAIKPGEPERAGRWWWENDEKRECGLHVADAASDIPARSSILANGPDQAAPDPAASSAERQALADSVA